MNRLYAHIRALIFGSVQPDDPLDVPSQGLTAYNTVCLFASAHGPTTIIPKDIDNTSHLNNPLNNTGISFHETVSDFWDTLVQVDQSDLRQYCLPSSDNNRIALYTQHENIVSFDEYMDEIFKECIGLDYQSHNYRYFMKTTMGQCGIGIVGDNPSRIDAATKLKYFSHVPGNDPLDWLTIEDIFKWKKGAMFAADRFKFHTSDNFIANGVASKRALIAWTRTKV